MTSVDDGRRLARRRFALGRQGWDGPRITVLVAAAASAIFACVLSTTVFSQLSVNNDEAVYLLQAKAIAGGHLFPLVGHPASSFSPWLGVIRGGHYVLKYVPVVSAFLAVSLVITGGYVAALACWAAALVFATYLLAREITGNRGTAALAAALLAASPVIVVQSALVLPYMPFMVLAELSVWGVLAGSRHGSLRVLSIAGLCGALAFVARPYDAILFLAPAIGWRLWSTASSRWRYVGGLGAGAALPCIGLLWFNRAATGSAFTLPFSLFSSGDTLGFGTHRVYPGEAPRNFGITQAWDGMSRHLGLLGWGWVAGGLVLVGFAAFALARRRVSSGGLALLAGGVLFTVGYLFFWGIWNAGVLWGAVRFLGPFYLMPLLAPVTILGAQGIRELLAMGVWRVVPLAAVGAALSAVTLFAAISTNSALNVANVQLATTVAREGRSLIFVDTYPNYLQHPTAVISNASPPGGRTIYALNQGASNFAVQTHYPGRPLYELRLLGEYGRHAHRGYGAVLDRLGFRDARVLTFEVSGALPTGTTSAQLLVTVGATKRSWAFSPRQAGRLRVTLSAGTAATRPPSEMTIGGVSPGPARGVTFTLIVTLHHGAHHLSRVEIPLLRGPGGRLHTLAPVRRVSQLGPVMPPLSVYAVQPV